jgi:N-acetylglucosaminyldiphosphoundecaprenol N-acetyl-beta-D-mannosaminyltransferase
MLATISVVGALKNTAFLVLVMPFLVLAFPLMEISYLLVFARRSTEQPEEEPSLPSDRSVALERRSYSLTSYLLALGMRQEQVALLAYLATAFVGAIAILLVALIKVHFAIKLLVLAIFLPAGFLIFYAAYKVLCPAGTGKETLEIFGIPIANLTSQEVSERIAEFIHSQQPHHVVTSDSLMLVRAQQDEDFRRILEKADLITPDGTGVVWAGRLLGQPIRERVSGVDLVERISQISAQRGFSVYLLGGQPGIAEEAAQVLRERHPGLNIVGIHHGYFSPEEEPEIITEIAGQRPDVLFVGLGAPRQEKWITKNLDRLQTPVCIGVGGSFDVISGHLSRAPLWMQRWGLEWLYRVLKEPKRLPRLLGLPKFMFMTARSLRGRAGERNKR